jgi:hypothetical protein
LAINTANCAFLPSKGCRNSVGAWRVGSGSFAADAMIGQQVAKGEALIGRAVVGHNALDRDAKAGEPGECAARESDGTLLAFTGQNLAVGEPAGVVDSDMKILPAGAALIALAGAISGNAVADAVDTAELFDIEVDQLARHVALIAHDLWLDVECAEPPEAETAQHGADGRTGQVELACDLRTGATLAA